MWPNAIGFHGESCVCCRYKQRQFVDIPRAEAELKQLDCIIADLTAIRNTLNALTSSWQQESDELHVCIYNLMLEKVARVQRNLNLPPDQWENLDVFEEHGMQYIAAGKARGPDGPPPASSTDAGDETMEP